MDSNAYILDAVLAAMLWVSMIKMFITVRQNFRTMVGDVNALAFDIKKRRPAIAVATMLLTALYWFFIWRQYALMQHFAADGISAVGITTVLVLAAPILALSYAVIASIPKSYIQSVNHQTTIGQTPYTQHTRGMSDYGGVGGL